MESEIENLQIENKNFKDNNKKLKIERAEYIDKLENMTESLAKL